MRDRAERIRAGRAVRLGGHDAAVESAHQVAETLDCVVAGCPEEARSPRGRRAGLCRKHGQEKDGHDARGTDFWSTVTRTRPFNAGLTKARREAGLPIIVQGASQAGRGVRPPAEALPPPERDGADTRLERAIGELQRAGNELTRAAAEFYGAKGQLEQHARSFTKKHEAVKQLALAVIRGD